MSIDIHSTCIPHTSIYTLSNIQYLYCIHFLRSNNRCTCMEAISTQIIYVRQKTLIGTSTSKKRPCGARKWTKSLRSDSFTNNDMWHILLVREGRKQKMESFYIHSILFSLLLYILITPSFHHIFLPKYLTDSGRGPLSTIPTKDFQSFQTLGFFASSTDAHVHLT
jgi:hypothetical protein